MKKEEMEKVMTEKIKVPESHKYWCEDCEGKFIAYEAKCPQCNGTNVGIDEPIIRRPKRPKLK